MDERKTKIYLISGLGADRRAFKKLIFPDQYEVVYLDWIEAHKNESLISYANRLSLGIDQSHPFILIGLSFGGMLATEIAKISKPLHTFLISSTPISSALPWYYKLAGFLSLQKVIPLRIMKQSNTFVLRFLGASTPEGKLLLRNLVIDSDPKFMKWALTAILEWRNFERPANLTHIHGTADVILPYRFNHPDVTIKRAGHFMVFINAEEIVKSILATSDALLQKQNS